MNHGDGRDGLIQSLLANDHGGSRAKVDSAHHHRAGDHQHCGGQQ